MNSPALVDFTNAMEHWLPSPCYEYCVSVYYLRCMGVMGWMVNDKGFLCPRFL